MLVRWIEIKSILSLITDFVYIVYHTWQNEVVNLLPSTQSPSESSDNHHSPAKDLSRNLREKDEEIVTLNEQIVTMQQQLELFSDNKVSKVRPVVSDIYELPLPCLLMLNIDILYPSFHGFHISPPQIKFCFEPKVTRFQIETQQLIRFP